MGARLDRAGDRISGGLSNMWCAVLFCCISLVSLPSVIETRSLMDLVSWLSQNFIQLVALSVLGAGQDKGARWLIEEIRGIHAEEREDLTLIREIHACQVGKEAQAGSEAQGPGEEADGGVRVRDAPETGMEAEEAVT